MMMAADQPRYVPAEEATKKGKGGGKRQGKKNALSYFQTKLKD
ncbi:unknown [Odoribacter sp. CAG:788]|nr:unknown [Odoribacter sp. CAG:788]